MYRLDSVLAAYRWHKHQPGWTELVGLHPEYKKGDYEFNVAHSSFPRIWYTRSEKDVIGFVKRYAPSRMVMWGLNPRPGILRNGKGFPRGARETDIETYKSILFDLDFEGETDESRQQSFDFFLEKAEEYFRDRGMKAPVRSFSGNGYHLFFALPAVSGYEHPDFKERLSLFREQFGTAYRKELERLEMRLDSTQDLKRMVKIPGTAKVGGNVSTFYGNGKRIEDEALRDYLFSLELPENTRLTAHGNGGLELGIQAAMPRWFHSLLERDAELQSLWSGNGKPNNLDTSQSGYDFSLVRKLLWLGYRDIDDLSTILALRPNDGAMRRDQNYIRRTIANALLK